MTPEHWESWKWIQGNMSLSGFECSEEVLKDQAENSYAKRMNLVPAALERIAAKTSRSFEEVGREFIPIIFDETEAGSTFPEVLQKHYPEAFDDMFKESNSKTK